MPLPKLVPSLVVQYEYKWERLKDRPNADKEHPSCVVVTLSKDEKDHVFYLPISHVPPDGKQIGYLLPDGVKKAAGLDSAPQWIIVSECNRDVWGTDLRTLPGQPGRFHYGHLPPGFFKKIRDEFLTLVRANKVQMIRRF